LVITDKDNEGFSPLLHQIRQSNDLFSLDWIKKQ
jgi:hypothetical protein